MVLPASRIRSAWQPDGQVCPRIAAILELVRERFVTIIPSLTSLAPLEFDGWSDLAMPSSDTRSLIAGQKSVNFRSAIAQLKQQHQQLMEQVNVQNAMTAISIGTEANRVSNNILFLDGIAVTYDVDAYHYRRPDIFDCKCHSLR